MNRVMLIGRLTRDPEIHYSGDENSTAVAMYTLAVRRRYQKEEGQDTDFITCVTFGKSAEFAEKYFRKGLRVAIAGRLQTGNYTNQEGNKVYVTEVVVEEQEFADSKNVNVSSGTTPAPSSESNDGFKNIPDGMEEETPFK